GEAAPTHHQRQPGADLRPAPEERDADLPYAEDRSFWRGRAGRGRDRAFGITDAAALRRGRPRTATDGILGKRSRTQQAQSRYSEDPLAAGVCKAAETGAQSGADHQPPHGNRPEE